MSFIFPEQRMISTKQAKRVLLKIGYSENQRFIIYDMFFSYSKIQCLFAVPFSPPFSRPNINQYQFDIMYIVCILYLLSSVYPKSRYYVPIFCTDIPMYNTTIDDLNHTGMLRCYDLWR